MLGGPGKMVWGRVWRESRSFPTNDLPRLTRKRPTGSGDQVMD